MDRGENATAEAPVFGALVPLRAGPDGAAGPRPCPKPLAAFLAQLLASADGTPAYRGRRRAEPEAASMRYGAGIASPCDARFECIL
jgi:hypothetical protein